MGAITGTLAKITEFSGNYKLLTVTATMAAASDTITLTLASHGISEIAGIVGVVLTGTPDANFLAVSASYSGLVITVKAWNAAGTASTAFADADISVTLIGK